MRISKALYIHHMSMLENYGLEIYPNKNYLESYSLCGLPIQLVPAFRGLKRACTGYTRYYFNGYAYDIVWWQNLLNEIGKYKYRIDRLKDAWDINYQKTIIMRPFWQYLKPSEFLLCYYDRYNWCVIGDTIIMKQFVEEILEKNSSKVESQEVRTARRGIRRGNL